MENKKAAIELSMTTIIVVIIGVVLLSLGLVWVRGVLTKITDLSDEAFALSEQEIDNLFSQSNSLLKVVPNDVEMKKGKTVKVGVILYNLEEFPIAIQARTEPIAAGTPLNCEFGDTLTTVSKEYNLNSGASETIKLVAESTSSTGLGTGGCDVIITSLTQSDTDFSLSEQLIVDVIG